MLIERGLTENFVMNTKNTAIFSTILFFLLSSAVEAIDTAEEGIEIKINSVRVYSYVPGSGVPIHKESLQDVNSKQPAYNVIRLPNGSLEVDGCDKENDGPGSCSVDKSADPRIVSIIPESRIYKLKPGKSANEENGDENARTAWDEILGSADLLPRGSSSKKQ